MNEYKIFNVPHYISQRRFESTAMKGRFIHHTPKSVTLLN